MKNLAIIPARGGSKRIPRKNIKPFMGKPIIAYSIEAALQSGIFDEVMVSTDDEEIAEVAKQYGANVPFMRSKKNSDDHATMEDVIEEVLNECCCQNKSFDSFCCILSTAPFLRSMSLINSHIKFLDGQYDSLFPVLRFTYPIQRALRQVDGRIVMREPQYIHSRSQDLEPMYHDSGLFYWMTVSKFMEVKEIFCDNSGMIELSDLEVQDIDTYEDWRMAEIKYQMLYHVDNNFNRR